VGLFRRRSETLNEQLLREAGLDPAESLGDPQPPREPAAEPEPRSEPETSDPPPFPALDVNLGHRARRSVQDEWDTIVTVNAAALAGARIEFTTLPNGDILVEQEEGDADLGPLAEAVERRVDPPYRASAARQGEGLWAVGARRIQVAKFEFAEGDAIELSVNDGTAEVRVDGEPSDAQVPQLEQLGEREGSNYCVEAGRIDGDFWEVKATAL
jgi:hypothetical protein